MGCRTTDSPLEIASEKRVEQKTGNDMCRKMVDKGKCKQGDIICDFGVPKLRRAAKL